jgi:hypothetical protein
MWKDPIVEEVHSIREQLAAEHDNNLHKIVEHVKEMQQGRGDKLVSRPPRRPMGWSQQKMAA